MNFGCLNLGILKIWSKSLNLGNCEGGLYKHWVWWLLYSKQKLSQTECENLQEGYSFTCGAPLQDLELPSRCECSLEGPSLLWDSWKVLATILPSMIPSVSTVLNQLNHLTTQNTLHSVKTAKKSHQSRGLNSVYWFPPFVSCVVLAIAIMRNILAARMYNL